ncbi:U11/U12 small nuclear ribonucleoprotein 31 kDa protein [Forsythia ovata]|uniref:U11/U12 small nuclear ribonucleoprotein 31 kDa protein n=1 Tax=Forsythia ovata TaxID=205694 RepID=A0ABD1VMS3_9LAMI
MSQKRNYSDDEEDETFYYCYTSRTSATSALPSSSSVVKPSRGGRGSDGLAPSKSMVYISNLDYNLTNSNFFTIFSTFSKVAKATVLKDCATHQSQGVAFTSSSCATMRLRPLKELTKKSSMGGL